MFDELPLEEEDDVSIEWDQVYDPSA